MHKLTALLASPFGAAIAALLVYFIEPRAVLSVFIGWIVLALLYSMVGAKITGKSYYVE